MGWSAHDRAVDGASAGAGRKLNRGMRGLAGFSILAIGIVFAPNAAASDLAAKPGVESQSVKVADTPIVPVGAGNADTPDRELTVDHAPNGLPYVAGELVVEFSAGTPGETQRAITQEAGAVTSQNLSRIDIRSLKFPKVKHEQSQAVRAQLRARVKGQLEQHPGVAAADYNQIDAPAATPNDPLFSLQWGLERINAAPAWDVSQGANTTMAILDSGIDYSNPDIGGVVGEYD